MNGQSLSTQEAVEHVFAWQQHSNLPAEVRDYVADVSYSTGLVREDHVDMVIDAIEKLDAPEEILESLVEIAGPEIMHIVFDYLHECGISPEGLVSSQGEEVFHDLVEIIELLEVDGALSLYIRLEKITGVKNPNTIGYHKLLMLVREHLNPTEKE